MTVPLPPSRATARPGSGAVLAGARVLAELAAEVRRHAAGLTAAATASGWRSTAAQACRARLGDAGRDLLGAAALLDHAADALEDHARTVARRAAALEHAAAEAVVTGALEVASRVLS